MWLEILEGAKLGETQEEGADSCGGGKRESDGSKSHPKTFSNLIMQGMQNATGHFCGLPQGWPHGVEATASILETVMRPDNGDGMKQKIETPCCHRP